MYMRISVLVAAVLFVAGPAWGGDFIDSRITFTIGDDNFLKRAGQQVPDSPKLGIGDREGYELSFDNLDLATSGRENQLRLVLYKKVEGILPGLFTEAAGALRIDFAELQQQDPRVNKVFQDDSSYIRLMYALDPGKLGTRFVDLVLFPLSGDRFRVGYLYDLTWGGTDMFPRRKGRLSPGFKLGGNHGRFYWWGGMKFVPASTAPRESKDEQGLTITTEELETFYSALAGVGVQPIDGLSIDLSGAHIQMAENPIKDVAGELVTATGFSARVAYGRGLKVGLSSDLRLLRNDPEFIEQLGTRPTYNPAGGVSWRVAFEANAIAQTLADPDRYGATTVQWATAGALDARLQWKYLRVNLTGVYRSLQFILLETPSFVPFQSFPKDAEVSPQIFGALSVDYHFARLGLTPGVQFGVELPAAVKTQLTAQAVGSNAPRTVIGENTIVIRANGRPDILPEGESRVPLVQSRVSLRWHASSILTLVGFAFITLDNNASVLRINPDLSKTRIFDDALRFGAGITAQARF
ncbi:MAG: hypothetical protein IT371_14190 [Deltaproteobacteria bacterium]|nr:hypothetical protein [Deltaproteobacteria bacterium]